MMNLQEVIKSVESLSTQDQVYLFDVLKSKLSKLGKFKTDENGIKKQEFVRSLRGMAFHSMLSSDEFALRKQEEIDWEDRHR